MDNKDKIKDRVLTENTAQGILNHLRDFESNRARMQKRWIWELLQNARDTSSDKDTHLVAKVHVNSRELVFQHNGLGFTPDEVAHLIYHGSTKLEDENKIGQYGSGFLTTHLLSPQIDVSGQLNDGSPFNFRLKREVGSTKALSDSMDRAWGDFDVTTDVGADRQIIDVGRDSFTTRYRYPIDEDSAGAVKEGIDILKRCAPFVVVFNRQFRRIIIESPDGTTSYEVIDRISLNKGLQRITVGINENGSLFERTFLIADNIQTSVAFPVEPTDHGLMCLPIENVPRLFLGFPLVGTETFSFPAVINSLVFTPTENRDGVYLGQSDDSANQTNQSVVEEACTLHIKLLDFVAHAGGLNTYRLAEIPPITEQTWLNSAWLQTRLRHLVSLIRNAPAVVNGHDLQSPDDAIIPLSREAEGVKELWDLLSHLKSFGEKLPKRQEAAGWCRTLRSWAIVMGCEVTSFDEGWDGNKLVAHLDNGTATSNTEGGTLESLQSILGERVDAVAWLDQLYGFLKSDGLGNLIRECRIIPDQAGYFDTLFNLYRDNNVAEELKRIGDDILHLGIRRSFRDTRPSSLANELGRGERSNREVVQEIVDKLQQLCDVDDLGSEFAQASSQLLAWLVAKQQWSYITDFPAFATRPGAGTRMVLWLGQRASGEAELPLAPIKAWAKDLQEYADLFPWQHIMANDFFTAMPTGEPWQMLKERDYVRTDVIVRQDITLQHFLPDEPLPDGEHKTVDNISVTDIVLLTKDRVGIMARVRDSQTRARLFWRFLTEWLIAHDPEGLEIGTAQCECRSKHRYYQATWLVPIVRNLWVPQGKDIRDRATAQSLANLLRDSGWTPDSLSHNPTTSQLLKAIRITRFDLMRHFVVQDDDARSALDDTMTNILVSTGGDLTHVRDFVEDMKTDRNLTKHLAERRERRRIVGENQRLGSLVEDLVKEGLQDEGFTVRRTGIGSDFEIKYDLIQENEEIGIELALNDRTWLVEVKATREQRVRMTARQADNAVERGDGFLLCVVSVGQDGAGLDREEVRANMRFVPNIGPLIEPLCTELDALNDLRDIATRPSNSDIQLEIEAGTARIRVDNAVWRDGVSLTDLSAHLK
ncbi:MAG: hypothetical protein OXN80_06585 [bacterium]|nr:hypothetical protein [bacterium]